MGKCQRVPSRFMHDETTIGKTGPNIKPRPAVKEAVGATVAVAAPTAPAPVGPVIIVTSLPTTDSGRDAVLNLQNLYVLFGVYGDVKRVKLLSPHIATIQFDTEAQAELASASTIRLYNRVIQVIPSRGSTLEIDPLGNFEHLRLYHKNQKAKLTRPNCAVHISGNVSERDKLTSVYVPTLFSQFGNVMHVEEMNHVNNFQAVICFDSTDGAATCIMALRNRRLYHDSITTPGGVSFSLSFATRVARMAERTDAVLPEDEINRLIGVLMAAQNGVLANGWRCAMIFE